MLATDERHETQLSCANVNCQGEGLVFLNGGPFAETIEVQ